MDRAITVIMCAWFLVIIGIIFMVPIKEELHDNTLRVICETVTTPAGENND